ncbi:MAG: MFS transporter [Sedimentisphaerales bacterium]|nr:MFS transporter [Sedimentisphaerales bacterium]
MKQLKATLVFEGIQSGHVRWGILLLLFLSTVNNYLDRQVLAVAWSRIGKELSLTAWHYSWIQTAWMLGTLVAAFFMGPLLDRWGARKGFVIAVVFWSIAGGFTSLACGFVSFFILRALLGVGEAGNWPCSTKAVSEWFPAKERAFAMGFFNSGVAIGSILAVPAVGFFIAWTGSWRWAFVASALIGIPWLYYWLKCYYPLNQHPKVSDEERQLIENDRIKPKGKKKVYGVLKKKAFWGLFLARFIISPLYFFIANWVFLYLSVKFDLNLKAQAAIAWIPFATMFAGNLFGGYCSGKLIGMGVSNIKSRKILMTVGALGMTVCIATAYCNIAWLALTLISIIMFAWGLWVSNMLGLMADSFPSEEMGTVMSWTQLGQLVGGILFTLYAGKTVEAETNYTLVFIVAGCLPIAGHICTLLLNREEKEPASASV